MGAFSWLAMLAGAALLVTTLADVLLAVLHADKSAPVSTTLQRLVWRACLAAARRWPRLRRPLVALAGPLMIAMTFVSWTLLFIVGFALLYWPHLHLFRAEPEITTLGFIEALYYSGVTSSVLGYGDITPLAPLPRMLAIVQSSLGFALITGIVTYLITVVSGVAERNALATRIRLASGGTSDGVQLVIRCLGIESVSDFRSRLQGIVVAQQNMLEKMLQFPVLDLYHRSRDPQRDPEPLLAAVADLALACRIVARRDELRSLQPLAEELQLTAEASMEGVLAQLRRSQRARREAAEPTPEDEANVERIRQRLAERFGPEPAELDRQLATELVRFAARSRSCLAELDQITGWKADHHNGAG